MTDQDFGQTTQDPNAQQQQGDGQDASTQQTDQGNQDASQAQAAQPQDAQPQPQNPAAQPPAGASDQSGQGGSDQIDAARQQAQGQINQTIDQFAGKIPGGDQLSQQAKDAASGGLNRLEEEAKKRLGGLFGGDKGNQG